MSRQQTNFDEDLDRQVSPLERQIFSVLWGAGLSVAIGGGVAIYALCQSSDVIRDPWVSGVFQGPVAAFWSLAGVGLIYVAFLGQRLQLIHQQQELRDTRAELRNHSAEFEVQNETAKRQRFEDTFFRMLQLHHEIVGALSLSQGGQTNLLFQGREALNRLTRMLQACYDAKPKDQVSMRPIADETWKFIYERNQSLLGHYFRNLYHVFKSVKESEVEGKRRYTSLARAQLSTAELCLLFYNCTVGEGAEKFLPLANEFKLFENLPSEALLDPQHRVWAD